MAIKIKYKNANYNYYRSLLFRNINNFFNEFTTSTPKEMVQGKIAWIIVNYFGIPMYILAIIDSWDTWKGVFLFIIGMITVLTKFLKYLVELLDVLQDYQKRRRDYIKSGLLDERKKRKDNDII